MWLRLFRFSWRFLFANVFLKSPRNDSIYQRPSFANGLGRYISKDESPKVRQIWKLKSMLRHHYSTRKYLLIIFLLISNDIQLSPWPLDSSTLKSCSLNARSIINKRTELQATVAYNQNMAEPRYNGLRNPVIWLLYLPKRSLRSPEAMGTMFILFATVIILNVAGLS